MARQRSSGLRPFRVLHIPDPHDSVSELGDYLREAGFVLSPARGLAEAIVVSAPDSDQIVQQLAGMRHSGNTLPIFVIGENRDDSSGFYAIRDVTFLNVALGPKQIISEIEHVLTVLRKAIGSGKQNRRKLRKRTAPPPGRIVRVEHDRREVKEVKSRLDQLARAARGHNSQDLFADPEERLAIVSEIEDLREKMNRPMVRMRALWEATTPTGVIGWLADKGGGGLIGAAATAAAAAILRWIGVL